MTRREDQVRAFLEDMQTLKRLGVFKVPHDPHMPKITPAQWNALFYVAESRQSTVKEVARTLGVTSSAATQLIDGLVRGGLVVRCPSREDRRIVNLELSQKSRGQVERLQKSAHKSFLKLFEVLNDKEFAQYLQLNKKIVERFSKQL